MVTKRVDDRCIWGMDWNGCFHLFTNIFGNLSHDGHALDLGDDIAILEGGGFVDDDGTVETVLGADILAGDVDRGTHWKSMWSVEVFEVDLTSDQEMFSDRVGVRTHAGDDFLALLLVSNPLIDNVHCLADTFVDWSASLSLERLMHDPAAVNKIDRGNYFFNNWRLDNRCRSCSLDNWSNLDRSYCNCDRRFNNYLRSSPCWRGDQKKYEDLKLKV